LGWADHHHHPPPPPPPHADQTDGEPRCCPSPPREGHDRRGSADALFKVTRGVERDYRPMRIPMIWMRRPEGFPGLGDGARGSATVGRPEKQGRGSPFASPAPAPSARLALPGAGQRPSTPKYVLAAADTSPSRSLLVFIVTTCSAWAVAAGRASHLLTKQAPKAVWSRGRQLDGTGGDSPATWLRGSGNAHSRYPYAS
jgi:hypothetical protein